MKKLFSILLVAVLVLTGGLVTAYAQTDAAGDQPITEIKINKICTLLWAGQKPEFSVEIDPEALQKIDVVSEKWIDVENESFELTLNGDNLAVAGGKYRYELTLSAKEGFAFDNDLKVNYQGIEGIYGLKYSFPPGQDSNHTMIVSGDFDNIIAESPINTIDVGKVLALVISGDYSQAVDFILDDDAPSSGKAYIDNSSHVSDDNYSYELVLKTKEGFAFSNKLEFLYDAEKYGYILDYKYDLSTDKHTLTIKGLREEKQPEPVKPDPADLRPGTKITDADSIITDMTGESDPKGTSFSKLRFRSVKQTGGSIKLSWNKLSKAKAYIIYGCKCGSGNKPKRLAAPTGNYMIIKKIGGKNLREGTYYKFIIVALDKNGKVVSASKLIHVAAKGSGVGNYKSVAVSKAVIARARNLKKGKALRLNARPVRQAKSLKVKKHVGLRYMSTNKKIATVSKDGTITAKKKGTCSIYVYAQNGVFKRIKVTVK